MAKKQKGSSHVTCSSSQSQSIPSANSAKHSPWIHRSTPGMFWIYRSVEAISLAPRRTKCYFELGIGHYLSPGVRCGLIPPDWRWKILWSPSSIPATTAKNKTIWEQFLLRNPQTDKLKCYNSVVGQIYESALCSKQAGFKQYLLEQQQMRWQLNTKITERFVR